MLSKKQRLTKALKAARTGLHPSPHPAVPVFVLGEMRSGTNMLTEAFERTPRTEVFNENDEHAFEAFALKPLADIAELVQRSRATHVVFKCIADNARAHELMERFPGSRIIWIYRRYQDVVNSALRKWTEHREYIRLVLEDPERAKWRRTNLNEDQLALFRRFYGPDLTDASARSLIWYVRNQNYFVQRLDERDDVLLVNYEQLVSDPGAELRRAFDFVNLQVSRRSFEHMNAESVRREPDTAIDPAIRGICDELMVRLDEVRGRAAA